MFVVYLVLVLALAVVFGLSFLLPWALGKLLGLFIPHAAAVGKAGGLFVVSLLAACLAFALLFGWRIVKVRQVEISFKDLPASFDGYKIAQFSDWHLGTYKRNHRTIEKEVEKVLERKPDLIVFTGDIVNYDPSEIEPFVETLSRLKAPDGVWSVMGNHDYCTYNPVRTPEALKCYVRAIHETEAKMGWRLLLNESAVIRRGADSLALVGVENDGNPPFPQLGDLGKATAGLPEGIFKILLSHDPTHWRREVLPDTEIQLTLSGHTHAMQLRLWGLSPAKINFDEWGGLYDEDGRKLFVSTGSGGNLPARFGAWPEVDIITLRKR